MQRRRFYLLAGRLARVACHVDHSADVRRRRLPCAGRSNRRKYQTRITSRTADRDAVRYPARARLHRIDVRDKNSLNVLSTPNRPCAFRVARPMNHLELRMRKFNVRVVFAYDWPLTLAGIEQVAGSGCAIEIVAVYRSATELVASLGSVDCDVVLVDYTISGDERMDGLALFDWLRRTRPNVGIVALVANENPLIFGSILAIGGVSIVSKFDEVGHVVTAIHSSYSGGRYLSPLVRRAIDACGERGEAPVKLSAREIEVIRLYLSGVPIKTIAQRLSKGKQTVSAQKISAMKKLGVSNDVELIQRAAGLGLGGASSVSRDAH